jgi:hypothetical protein
MVGEHWADEIGHHHRPGHRSVRLPQCIIGFKKKSAIDVYQSEWAAIAGCEAGQHHGPSCGPIRFPELISVGVIVGGKEQSAPDSGEIFRIRPARAWIDVLDQFRDPA